MSALERVLRLTCTTNGSDKIYVASLIPRGNGWIVKTLYGPRNRPTNEGQKHREPMDYAKAEKDFKALVRSKLRRGYIVDSAGADLVRTTEWLNFRSTKRPVEKWNFADSIGVPPRALVL